jgi:signal transduction histidine kinase
VVAWEADIFHAFYNLLHNSIYWVQRNSPDNRKIVVSAKTRPKANSEGESEVVVVVSDNGPGVSTQAAPWIFDLGYTEKPDGYGVGLFIAREAIERSGGRIELLNPGEKGAQFQIVLEGV